MNTLLRHKDATYATYFVRLYLVRLFIK